MYFLFSQRGRMGADAERSSRRWKWIAFVALLVAGCSLAALAAGLAFSIRLTRVIDERLIGTWQSDADRTIAGIREQRPVDDKQEAGMRKLYGKMRVTYTPSTYTTELDGTTETCKYEVLGKDKHSVSIREVERKP